MDEEQENAGGSSGNAGRAETRPRKTGKDRGASDHARRLRWWNLVPAQAARRSRGEFTRAATEEAALAHAVVGRAVLAEERELALRRFLAYRYLNPYEATEAYLQEYERQWRRWMEDALGIKVQGPPLPLARRPDREVVALWRGRQVADALGMSYRAFIDSGFQYMVQESGKKRLPRPNQLYGKEQVDRAIKMWDEPEERLYEYEDVVIRKLPARFWLPSQSDDPVQRSAIPDYVWYVNHHDYRVYCLAKLIGSVLTEAQALELFPEELVAQAMERVRTRDPIPLPEVDPLPFAPSCLGFAYDPLHTVCQRCPFAKACAQQTSEVLETVKQHHGSEDPRAAKRREADRLRQQAYRRRKKGATDVADPAAGSKDIKP